jgi:hypothetical protein
MKRAILCILLFFAAFDSYAQKCKFDFEEVDKITNQETKGIFIKESGHTVALYQYHGENLLILTLTFNGQKRDIVSKGDTLLFKLEDGNLIELISSEEFVPVSQATQYGVYTAYSIKYVLDKEAIGLIKRSPGILIRAKIGAAWFDVDYSKKKWESIRKAAACIELI